MTVQTMSHGSPEPAAGPERGRFSIEALQESKPARALLGLVLAAIVVGIAYLIVLTFTGNFTNVAKVNAQLPSGSNAVPIEAPVEYRNVTVGKVGSETQGPNGTVAVQFLIYPKNLRLIPHGVQAQVQPLSIFGNQFVNLVPPATSSAGHLQAGDFVPAFQGAPSTSLQGTVTQLYNLLNAIHPADLDTALTAFATALNGEGRSLGQALSGTSDYLGAVEPRLPTMESDLRMLPQFSSNLEAATPNILGTLSNSSVTAETITSQESALHGLLTAGTASVGKFAGVLQRVQSTLPTLLNESGPLLADITQNPQGLSETLSGLTQFASAVAAHEEQGPFLSVNANLPVANISAGVNAALGYDNPASVSAALGGTVNPATYTSANCPEYPGESNPYCGVGGSPDATPAGPASVAVSSQALHSQALHPQAAPSDNAASVPVTGTQPQSATATDTLAAASWQSPYDAELNAVSAIASSLDGGRPLPAPGLTDLVLLPLLSAMTQAR